jgi:penicillin-binding protein 1A
MVERLGLPNPMAPFLPSALGATEEPLLAMTSAYAIFAGGGMRVHPHYIRRVVDREGKELERWEPPKPERVLDPYVASTVVSLMQGVVNFGTAARIRSAAEFKDWQIGGKTGTVNDFTDAWFIGYTPVVSTGVWIGFDEKRSIGNKETGSVAALPIWMDFMKEYLKDKTPKPFRIVNEMPDWVVTAREQTGKQGEGAAGPAQLPAPVASGLPPVAPNAADAVNQQTGANGGTRPLPDIILKPTQGPVEPPKEKDKDDNDPKKKRPGKNG